MDQGGLFEVSIDKLPNNVTYDDGVYYDGKIVYTSMGIPACDLYHDNSAVAIRGRIKWVWYWTPLRVTPFMKWFRFFVYIYKDGKLKGSNFFENGVFSYDLGEWSWTGFDIAGDILNLNPGRTDLYSVDSTQDTSSTDTFDQSDELLKPVSISDNSTDSNESQIIPFQVEVNGDLDLDVATGESPYGTDSSQDPAVSSSSAIGGFDRHEITSSDAYWDKRGMTTPLDYTIGYRDENNIFHPSRDYYDGKFRDPVVLEYIAALINDNVSEGIQEAEKPTFDFSEWDE